MFVKTDRLMSRREVEHVTGRARTTLYRMAMSGELCPRKVRGRLGYLESEVQQYLTSLPVVGPKSNIVKIDSPSTTAK
jgi:predicted DNA-binding transcriptional regulator AlpA